MHLVRYLYEDQIFGLERLVATVTRLYSTTS
jgi:hypothetical protein